MDFNFSAKSIELQEKLRSFMDAHVYPNEKRHEEEIASGERWELLRLVQAL